MTLKTIRLNLMFLVCVPLWVGCGGQSSFPVLGAGGNGDGYPGGDDLANIYSGKYLQVVPEYTCRTDSGRVSSHRYAVEIKKYSIIEVEGNICSETVTQTNLAWRHLDIATYNTNYIGRGNHIYTKQDKETGESLDEMAAETLCRLTEDGTVGFDILIKANADRTAHTGVIFWGEVTPEGFKNHKSEEFDVTRERLGDGIYKYSNETFELVFDLNQLFGEKTGNGRYLGVASGLPAGPDFTGRIPCRSHMALRSTNINSK